MNSYHEFLKKKVEVVSPSGFEVELDDINQNAFEWQKHCIRWACRRGRCALFLDTGLGKTLHQLEWSRFVSETTGQPSIIVAPLAVCQQTLDEHEKFDIDIEARYVRYPAEIGDGINITNYERLERFKPDMFGGICLDESSILKSFEGKFRNFVCTRFKHTPYRLACSATPSPNDFMELGNHSEFLSAMSRTEMLSTYFIHDSGDTSKWRLKGHAQNDFWHWVSSWALMIRRPSDLGYPDTDYILPGLNIHVVEIPWEGKEALTLTQQRRVRSQSVSDRVDKLKSIITDDEPWLIWCDRNDESEQSTEAITDAVEVTGSMPGNTKSQRMRDFTKQNTRILVTKPKISGFGMNWQHCSKMIFNGLSHSFEAFYQAVRRCYRFGQTKEVDVYIIITDKEKHIVGNVMRKQQQLEEMSEGMVAHMKTRIQSDIFGVDTNQVSYEPEYTF